MSTTTAPDVAALRRLIDREMAAPAQGLESAALAAPEFCAIWAQAKPILLALASFIVIIPGFGASAAAVLRGLVAVADEIAKHTCR